VKREVLYPSYGNADRAKPAMTLANVVGRIPDQVYAVARILVTSLFLVSDGVHKSTQRDA
jgi:hypothetical protein